MKTTKEEKYLTCLNTTDLKRFKMNPFNRGGEQQINNDFVEYLVNNYNTKQWLFPLVVEEGTNIILDGNHRYEALSILAEKGVEVPFWVMFVSFDSEEEKRVYLTQLHRARHYTGQQAMIMNSGPVVKEFCEDHVLDGNELSSRLLSILLCGSTRLEDDWKNGRQVTPSQVQLEYADKLFNQLVLILSALASIPKSRIEDLFAAWFDFYGENAEVIESVGFINLRNRLGRDFRNQNSQRFLSKNDFTKLFYQKLEECEVGCVAA